MNHFSLTREQKYYICVLIAEDARTFLQTDGAKDRKIKEALQLCQVWINKKGDFGDDLWDYLNNEEDNFIYSLDEEETSKENAWFCIVDALMYIVRGVYEESGSKFFPEPIELVDEGTFTHMISSFEGYRSDAEHRLQEIYEECRNKALVPTIMWKSGLG